MSRRLKDGYRTLITFANFPSVKFYEKEVTPPGIEGGGENDTTTMHNNEWRTRQPKNLKTLSESNMSCSYDPVVYQDILTLVNQNQLMTITFPDGDEVDFWGWVDEFKPGAHKEGEMPLASVKIIPSNEDDDGIEVAPVYRAAA